MHSASVGAAADAVVQQQSEQQAGPDLGQAAAAANARRAMRLARMSIMGGTTLMGGANRNSLMNSGARPTSRSHADLGASGSSRRSRAVDESPAIGSPQWIAAMAEAAEAAGTMDELQWMGESKASAGPGLRRASGSAPSARRKRRSLTVGASPPQHDSHRRLSRTAAIEEHTSFDGIVPPSLPEHPSSDGEEEAAARRRASTAGHNGSVTGDAARDPSTTRTFSHSSTNDAVPPMLPDAGDLDPPPLEPYPSPSDMPSRTSRVQFAEMPDVLRNSKEERVDSDGVAGDHPVEGGSDEEQGVGSRLSARFGFGKSASTQQARSAKRGELAQKLLRRSGLAGGLDEAAQGAKTRLLRAQRLLLHPRGKLKNAWDMVMLLPIIYTAILMPFTLCFDLQEHAWVVLDNIAWGMFITDMVVIFNTAVEESRTGNLIIARKEIARMYMYSWFVIDFVSIVPWSLLPTSGAGGGDTQSAGRLARIFRLPRALRVLRVFKLRDIVSNVPLLKSAWQSLQDTFVSLPAFLVVARSMVVAGLITHWLACVWHFLGTISSPDGNLENLDEDNWLVAAGVDGSSTAQRYGAAVYWAVATMTSVGYGDVGAQNLTEQWYSTLVMLVGLIGGGIIVADILAIMSSLHSSSQKQRARREGLMQLLRTAQPPRELRRKLMQWLEDSNRSASQASDVMPLLPMDLRRGMLLHMNKPLVEGIHLLRNIAAEGAKDEDRIERGLGARLGLAGGGLSMGGGRETFKLGRGAAAVADVVWKLQRMSMEMGAQVFLEGTTVTGMYFLYSGRVQLVRNGAPVMEFQRGGFFGEIESCGFFGQYQTTATVLSPSVEVYFLSKADLEMLSQKHSSLFGIPLKSVAIIRIEELGLDLEEGDEDAINAYMEAEGEDDEGGEGGAYSSHDSHNSHGSQRSHTDADGSSPVAASGSRGVKHKSIGRSHDRTHSHATRGAVATFHSTARSEVHQRLLRTADKGHRALQGGSSHSRGGSTSDAEWGASDSVSGDTRSTVSGARQAKGGVSGEHDPPGQVHVQRRRRSSAGAVEGASAPKSVSDRGGTAELEEALGGGAESSEAPPRGLRRSLSSSGQLQQYVDEQSMEEEASSSRHSKPPSGRNSHHTAMSSAASSSAHDSTSKPASHGKRNARLRGARASIFAGLGLPGTAGLAGVLAGGGRTGSVSHHSKLAEQGTRSARNRTQTMSDLPMRLAPAHTPPPPRQLSAPGHDVPGARLESFHGVGSDDSEITSTTQSVDDVLVPLSPAAAGPVRLQPGTSSSPRRQSEPPPAYAGAAPQAHVTAVKAVRPSANAATGPHLGGSSMFEAPPLDLLHSAIEEGCESGDSSTIASTAQGSRQLQPALGTHRGSFLFGANLDAAGASSDSAGGSPPPGAPGAGPGSSATPTASRISRPPPPPQRSSKANPAPPPGQSRSSASGGRASRVSSQPPPAPPRQARSVGSRRKPPPAAPPRGMSGSTSHKMGSSTAGSSTPTMVTAPDRRPPLTGIAEGRPQETGPAEMRHLPGMRVVGGSTPPPRAPMRQSTSAMVSYFDAMPPAAASSTGSAQKRTPLSSTPSPPPGAGTRFIPSAPPHRKSTPSMATPPPAPPTARGKRSSESAVPRTARSTQPLLTIVGEHTHVGAWPVVAASASASSMPPAPPAASLGELPRPQPLSHTPPRASGPPPPKGVLAARKRTPSPAPVKLTLRSRGKG